MSTTKRLWRWRSNPLRRHEDVVGAWGVLTVWVTVAVAGAAAGLVTARGAEHEFAEQRAHRHAVRAVLVAVAALVFGAGAFARARLARRRMARWDQEWDSVWPQWGPKTG